MRTLLIGIVLACLLFCAGCRGEKDAQLYAGKLNEALKSYQTQVNEEIAAEEKSYKELATVYGQVREDDVLLTLDQERIERAEKMTDDFLGDRKTMPTRSEIKGLLLDYAMVDFEQTRGILGREADASAKYLDQLEKIEADSAGIEALSQSLNDLAKPVKPLDQLKRAVAFGQCVKKELEKLECADLAKQLANQVTSQTKTVADLQTKGDAEKDATVKEQLNKQLADAKAALDALNKQKTDTDKKCAELAKVNCTDIPKDEAKDKQDQKKEDKATTTTKPTP